MKISRLSYPDETEGHQSDHRPTGGCQAMAPFLCARRGRSCSQITNDPSP